MSATPPSVARKTTTQVFPLGTSVPNDTIAIGEMQCNDVDLRSRARGWYWVVW